MCGRFTLAGKKEQCAADLPCVAAPTSPPWPGTPRYNVAPGQNVPVVVDGVAPAWRSACWGLPGNSRRLVNVRLESMLRGKHNARSCLIPADGFFEWRGRQTFYFQQPDHSFFAMAGIYCAAADGKCFFAVVTCPAVAPVSGIHPRMPLIIRRTELRAWLAGEIMAWEKLVATTPFAVHPVSNLVNDVSVDDPRLIMPVPAHPELNFLG